MRSLIILLLLAIAATPAVGQLLLKNARIVDPARREIYSGAIVID
jgi:adenine deaminase